MGKVIRLITEKSTAYLIDEENNETIEVNIDEKAADKLSSWTEDEYVIKLGKPNEEGDSNMVDEGAMTSVQYYYDLRDSASKKPKIS